MWNADRHKMRWLCVAALLVLSSAYVVSGTSLDEVKTDLEQARVALRLSQATETRLTSELQQLQQSGTVSPDTLKNHERALHRVRAMVVTHQQRVHTLETTCARLAPTRALCRPTPVLETSSSPALALPDQPEVDQAGALEREFNDALAVFDGMLLREMETARAHSAKQMTDAARESTAATSHLQGQGTELNPSAANDSSEESLSTEKAEAVDRRDKDSTTEIEDLRRTRQHEASAERKGQHTTRQPQDSPRLDEDIVARQLREAAEQETDPALREKLWKEYEDYTRGRK